MNPTIVTIISSEEHDLNFFSFLSLFIITIKQSSWFTNISTSIYYINHTNFNIFKHSITFVITIMRNKHHNNYSSPLLVILHEFFTVWPLLLRNSSKPSTKLGIMGDYSDRILLSTSFSSFVNLLHVCTILYCLESSPTNSLTLANSFRNDRTAIICSHRAFHTGTWHIYITLPIYMDPSIRLKELFHSHVELDSGFTHASISIM